jgi:hypothetical protein
MIVPFAQFPVGLVLVAMSMTVPADEPASAICPENQDHVRSMVSHWASRRAMNSAKVSWSTVLYRDLKYLEGGPSKGSTLLNTETFWVGRGNQKRHHLAGKQRRPDDRIYVSLNTTYTDNGDGEWKQFTVQPEDSPAPNGWVRAERWGQQSYLPVILYFSRYDKLGDPATFQVLDNSYSVNGRNCVYVESPERLGQRIRRLAVDPERNYVITQFDYISATNELLLQFRIDYQPHAELGWIPTRWTHTNWNADGSLFDHRQAAVIVFEINETYPFDTFDFQFPPGTVVHDEIQKTRYVVAAEEARREESSAEASSLDGANDNVLSLLVRTVVLSSVVAVIAAFCFRRTARPKK